MPSHIFISDNGLSYSVFAVAQAESSSSSAIFSPITTSGPENFQESGQTGPDFAAPQGTSAQSPGDGGSLSPATNSGTGRIYITTPALEAQRQNTAGTEARPAPVHSATFSWGGYFQAIGLLLFVLLCLWAGLRLARRVSKGRLFPAATTLPRSAFSLEGQLMLGQSRGVFVVRFLNKRFLLGVTDQQINLLTEVDLDEQDNPDSDSSSAASPDGGSPDFGQYMRSAGRTDE